MKRANKPKKLKPFNLEHEVRGLGVMMEHLNDKFTLMGEVLGVHTKNLDSQTKMLEAQARLLEAHTYKLDAHTEMIGNIMTDIEFIKHDLRKKTDGDEFAALERRVALLERKR